MKLKETGDFPIPFSVSDYIIRITKIDYRFFRQWREKLSMAIFPAHKC